MVAPFAPSPVTSMRFPLRLFLVSVMTAGALTLVAVASPDADAARRPKPPSTTTTTSTTSPTSTSTTTTSTSPTSTSPTSTSTTSTSTTSTSTTTLPPGTATGTAVQLLGMLATRAEVDTGYSRTLFTHWIDADGDGCNARYEVLIAESLTAPVVVAPCSISNTTWFSAYDGITEYLPADVDIDHVVALKEAWDSGAWSWASERRRAFANDLDDPRSLIAVTDNVNASKGDMDPAQWMPPRVAYHCQYLFDWIAVKVRWSLAVDSTERTALSTRLASCPSTLLTVRVA